MDEYEKPISPGTRDDTVDDFFKTPHPNAEVVCIQTQLARNVVGRVGAWALTSSPGTVLASLRNRTVKNSWA